MELKCYMAFLKLFLCFVICEGKRIEKNQEAVCFYFFDEKVYEKYVNMNPQLNEFGDPGVMLNEEFLALSDFQVKSENEKAEQKNS